MVPCETFRYRAKIKFYLGVKGNSQEDAAKQLDELAANVKAMFS